MNKLVDYIKVIAIFVLLFCIIEIIETIQNNSNQKIDNPITTVDNLEIYFLDVGEADSTLIRKDNTNILIDGGNNKDGKKLVNYFKQLNINTFDYIIATHPHEDHIGGLDYIIREFNVDNYLETNIKQDNYTYQEIIKETDKKNIKRQVPKIDDEIKIDDLIFKILYLDDNIEDINNSSIIIRLEYKNTSYLFMADANKDEEIKILDKDIKSDVLKVGHHGSQYATSANLLEKVKPRYSIISCGLNNDYGFPKQVTLDKLNKINSKIYRTDQDHTIKLISDGENINIETLETDTNQEE